MKKWIWVLLLAVGCGKNLTSSHDLMRLKALEACLKKSNVELNNKYGFELYKNEIYPFREDVTLKFATLDSLFKLNGELTRELEKLKAFSDNASIPFKENYSRLLLQVNKHLVYYGERPLRIDSLPVSCTTVQAKILLIDYLLIHQNHIINHLDMLNHGDMCFIWGWMPDTFYKQFYIYNKDSLVEKIQVNYSQYPSEIGGQYFTDKGPVY